MKKAKITIVILNYNTQELVVDCLESIKNSENIDFIIKVIVIDNASTDDSVPVLKKIKWIHLIKSENNGGFAKGNNLAIPHMEGEYVWFLNPDTVVEPKTISYMVKYMDEHPDVGIATPKLSLTNGEFDKNCHRGFPTPWNSFCHFSGLGKIFPRSKLFAGYYLGYLPESEESEVDVVGGSSVLIRKEIGDQIGWWDEGYFMYGEDIAISYEVKKLGYKVMYVPGALIHHYHGASSGLKRTSKTVTKASKETKLRSVNSGVQAMRIFYKKYYQGKYPKLLTSIILFCVSVLGTFRAARIKLLG